MSYKQQHYIYEKCMKVIRMLRQLQEHSLYLSTQSQYMNHVLKQTRSIPNNEIYDTRSSLILCKRLLNMNLIKKQKIHIYESGYDIQLYKIDIKPHGSFVLDRCRIIMNQIQNSWKKANQHPKKQSHNVLISILCLLGSFITLILHTYTWISITLLAIPSISLIDSIYTSFKESYNNKRATKLGSELQSILGVE